jgi:hypothetical protein
MKKKTPDQNRKKKPRNSPKPKPNFSLLTAQPLVDLLAHGGAYLKLARFGGHFAEYTRLATSTSSFPTDLGSLGGPAWAPSALVVVEEEVEVEVEVGVVVVTGVLVLTLARSLEASCAIWAKSLKSTMIMVCS